MSNSPLPYGGSTPPARPAHRLEVLISAEKIQQRTTELGAEISKHYQGKDPVIITVLKGAFIFVSDLVRCIECPITTEFMRVSSYGNKVVTSGEVKMELDIASSVANRHVLLVEDIIDTGLTILVRRRLALCALLSHQFGDPGAQGFHLFVQLADQEPQFADFPLQFDQFKDGAAIGSDNGGGHTPQARRDVPDDGNQQ